MTTPRRVRSALCLLPLVLVGCAAESSNAPLATDASAEASVPPDAEPPDTEAPDTEAPETEAPETSPSDAVALPDTSEPDHTLPFELTRPALGAPITPAETAAATDALLQVLEQTRYHEFVDERVHGWPESVPGGYWYGTWWSGVTVIREGGRVTYRHSPDGADNNGLRSAQLMEGACYATRLWDDPIAKRLTRELLRGYNSWSRGMERTSKPDAPAMLTRAIYPAPLSTDEHGLPLDIDTSLNRPGEDNGATEYVHLEDSPHYPDLWVKNKRSKDDLGHMLRGLSQMVACEGLLGDDGAAELAEARERYAAFARQVVDDGWRIATWDKAGEVWYPDENLAMFEADLGDIECGALLALQLAAHGEPGDLDCGDGVSVVDDAIILTKSSNRQIIWTFHEAGIALALEHGQDALAKRLLQGLIRRLDGAFDALESGVPIATLNDSDLAQLVVHAANLGVPLTAREVRWMHVRLELARASVSADDPVWRVFDAATPDGTYAYEPGLGGLDLKGLGALLGFCGSP